MTILMLIIRLTLVILVATCCSALIPVIYGGPVNQAKHEAASQAQSLLSKDLPSMDVNQDLESVNYREGFIMPNRPIQHRMASDTPTKPAQRKSKKLPRRTKKHRHESTTPSASSALASFTTSTSTTSPAESTATPTLSPTISSASTTTTANSPTTAFEDATSTTTSTTTTTTTRTRPAASRQNPPISRRDRTSRRPRLNHSKRNLIKLRSKCFPGYVTIGTTEVASRKFDKSNESEAFLEIVSLNSSNKNKTIVALRGDKSGHYLCVDKERGFVPRKLRPNSIPRECQFIEKHLNGKFVRYVSYRGPRRFLSFDDGGKAVPWRNRKEHKIHSKSCTNFLRVVPAKNNHLIDIIREHLLPKP